MAIKRYGVDIRPGRKVPVATLANDKNKLWVGNIHQPPRHLRHVIAAMCNETSADVTYSYSYRLSSSNRAIILAVKAGGTPIFIGRAEHLPKRLHHLKDIVAGFVNEIRESLRAANKR